MTGVQLGCGTPHPYRPGVQVDVAPPQLGQFLRAHRGERAEQHHQAPPQPDHIGQGENLRDRGDGALVRLLAVDAADPARVLADHVVLDHRPPDGLEQPLGQLCRVVGERKESAPSRTTPTVSSSTAERPRSAASHPAPATGTSSAAYST
ncbi:hypothetical protein KQY30_16325 [Streptomyces sp. GMY02]|nr:hypothetical protein KQY30_16325 [Streptomyces sp. GMY02]